MKAVKALVLAAGKGTRLQTEGCDLPKVMRLANGKPLLHYVLQELQFLSPADTVIVVGYQREKVTPAFPDYGFAVQEQQLGTGHAVMSASKNFSGFSGNVLVCYGDMPLLKRETYEALLAEHTASGASCTILSGTCEEDLPYGRIVRDEAGNFVGVVEDKDCTPEQKKIRELNIGVYVFDAEQLFSVLGELRSDNAQGEYYLTDVPAIMMAHGMKVSLCCRELNEQVIGVNTVEQLRMVESCLQKR